MLPLQLGRCGAMAPPSALSGRWLDQDNSEEVATIEAGRTINFPYVVVWPDGSSLSSSILETIAGGGFRMDLPGEMMTAELAMVERRLDWGRPRALEALRRAAY